MLVTCIEITHDGEGEPGRSVELGPVLIGCANEAQDYAERAAHQFDREDAVDARFSAARTVGKLDNTSRVIEVRGLPGGPTRFRVVCKVVRDYTATRLEG